MAELAQAITNTPNWNRSSSPVRILEIQGGTSDMIEKVILVKGNKCKISTEEGSTGSYAPPWTAAKKCCKTS